MSCYRPGDILRFVPMQDVDYTSRPRPPLSSTGVHPQGNLLDIKDGRLIVSFDHVDIWPLGDVEHR